jgi:hypothetical protein
VVTRPIRVLLVDDHPAILDALLAIGLAREWGGRPGDGRGAALAQLRSSIL